VSDTDLTITLLRDIRSRIDSVETNLGARIESVETRIDSVERNLGARLDVVAARVDAVDVAMKDLAGQHLVLTRYVKNPLDRHGKALDRHDGEIEVLDERVTSLETTKP
jgi:hypothetical protein